MEQNETGAFFLGQTVNNDFNLQQTREKKACELWKVEIEHALVK